MLKVGIKAYDASRNKNVLILEIRNGRASVYDEERNVQYVASTQELYEINEAPPIRLTNKNQKKEGIGMNIKNLFGEFGKVKNNEVALTFSGKVAVKRSNGEYVRYDEEKELIENHNQFIFEGGSKLIYIMPVTVVEAGDIIKDKGNFFQVLEVKENGSLVGVNLAKGTRSTICKETNAFGFNFYYKVTSLANGFAGNTGAFNPAMLMLMGEGKGDMKDILMLQAFSGNAQGQAFNPMMLMLMGEDKGSDLQELLMLQAFAGNNGLFGQNVQTPVATPVVTETQEG